MEGERIDLGSSRTDSVSKFSDNANISYKRLVGRTDFGDDEIKQIVHDAVDSQSLQPEKMRMLIQLSAKQKMLRDITSLINSLGYDLIQQQNRPVPVSESKKIRHQAALLSEVATDDKITHWSGYESNPYFAFPVIQTAGYASIQSYIAQRLVLEQPGTYAEEGGFTLSDEGIQDPRELGLLAKIADWLNKFKFEEKKNKIANAIGQSIEELLGSTSHELPSIEESMAGLPLNPLWLFLASQLRILVNPRFIMSCNPLNPFQQAELMKHTEVSTYPSESLTDFERYFFPKQETFDAKKLVTLRANSPIRVGNERVGSDMNASVLRLWLPAHARLCGLEVTAGKKRIPLEHRQDYYLELDQKRGYYRLVFTEKGKSVVQSAGSECQYQAELLASETPHMVPVFTQHNEHRLKEAIGALDEAGYTQIASNLETSFEQKKELTSVGRMVKKLQQRIVAKAGENTSGFWQQMNTVCIGILKRQVFTTEDIAQAVKKGSRYSFHQQNEFTPLTLAEQVANFPKAEPDGRFVGQCVQSSILLTLLEQFVFGGKETNFHSGVLQNRFLIPGIGRAYFGVGHQNTRGREGDKRVVHDATAPLASAFKDVLNWFAKRQNEDNKAVHRNERQGELRGKADLSWAAEKSPQSQKELLFTEITTFAQEYVDRMVETIKMRGPSTAQGYGQQVPRYIAQTGGLLDRLSKMTQGDVPVLDDENQRSQVIEELVVRSAQWSDMNTAVQKQGLGPTRSARAHNRAELGPGIEHMSWVAGRLNLLLHRLQNYPV